MKKKPTPKPTNPKKSSALPSIPDPPKPKKKPAKKKAATSRHLRKPPAIELPEPEKPAKKKRSAWDRLTLKQKKFIKAFFETENATEAAIRAGYSPKGAAVKGSETIRSPNGGAAIAEILDKAGLTDDFIAARLREGVDAKEIKFFSFEGIVTDQRETVDYPTRHQYLATSLKAKGHLRNKVDVKIENPADALPDGVIDFLMSEEGEE